MSSGPRGSVGMAGAVFESVQKILCEVLSVETARVTPDTNMENLREWDSMNQLRIVIELEKKFSIKFKPNEMATLNSVENIMLSLRLKKVA